MQMKGYIIVSATCCSFY